MSDRVSSTVAPQRPVEVEKQTNTKSPKGQKSGLVGTVDLQLSAPHSDLHEVKIMPSVTGDLVSNKSELYITKFLFKLGSVLRRYKQQVPEPASLTSYGSSDAELIVMRARGSDLEKISPLGALQMIIERINIEAKDETSFRLTLARQLFSKEAEYSRDRIKELWESSPEKKAIDEVYNLIKKSQKLRRGLSFREAFSRVYESKKKSERCHLDRIAKAIIFHR
jgi:hypothetical protein